MMGRMYTIPLISTAVSAAVDLAEIVTAATQVCWIHAIELGQTTETGDAAEEMLTVIWKSGQTTTGSGGNTGVVAVPVLLGDAASGLTIESYNTTKATAGTIVTHRTWIWNVRIPFEQTFTPEKRLFLPPSTRATLELLAAPGDPVTMVGQIVVEVVG